MRRELLAGETGHGIVKAIGACLILSTTFTACAPSGPSVEVARTGSSSPADAASFKAKRDRCDHFRGEEPYDAARARFLADRVARDCRDVDLDGERLRRNPMARRSAP